MHVAANPITEILARFKFKPLDRIKDNFESGKMENLMI